MQHMLGVAFRIRTRGSARFRVTCYCYRMGINSEALERSVVVSDSLEDGSTNEWCPLPPIGQLPLEQIIEARDDAAVNALFKIRYPDLDLSDLVGSRRKPSKNILALKRVLLARLEGIDAQTIASHAERLSVPWKTANSITSTLSQNLARHVVDRVRSNGDSRIRLAAIQSSPKLRKLITDLKHLTGIPFDRLFKALPAYKTEAVGLKPSLHLELLIEGYLLAQGRHGLSWRQIARNLTTDSEINPTAISVDHPRLYQNIFKLFSDEALDLLPQRDDADSLA